ncbi:Crp/Fnr family transcriptional regulator [Sphingomonas sp. IC-56]|uniref:Crp/Fnr family transcriptional regulator n=1 Tax=Sphingomonas sp. IC-56 TaxID=2898529 RepID=UPI001E5BF5BF|nr:Crp/Fnr family transcriptional regulator [Sphingomonas sp. IC-56]MCD2325089.1 Crp/Fnr family transcriptional regulator [Sphingomonas sp. IC-56]
MSLHRLEEFATLCAGSADLLENWASEQVRYPAGAKIRKQGDPATCVYFLAEGWVGSSMSLADGRRQFMKIHLPGDVLGSPSMSLSAAAETLEAFTEVSIAHVPHRVLGQLIDKSPRFAATFLLSVQKERVALMYEKAILGQGSAMERMAWFLLDLHARLRAADMADEDGFDSPLKQEQIADLLGMTPVHASRTLTRLQREGLIERRRGRITFCDVAALRALCPCTVPPFVTEPDWLPKGSA